MDFYQDDPEALWSQIKRKDNQIQLKRRWLLGLPLSESELHHFQKPHRLDPLPESFLREDDLFYETVESSVQVAFGACKVVEETNKDSVPMPDTKTILTALSLCLDDLTTKGLHVIATTLTGGSVKFVPTRWEMKKIIRESLRRNFGNHDDQKVILKQLSQHLSDTKNFRDKCVGALSISESPCLAVRKVLDRLQDLPTHTLYTMRRKLKGEQRLPRLEEHREWNRQYVINQLRNTCEEMLSELGTSDELQESLAKTMTIADLSVKLQPGFHNFTRSEFFYQFSPEIKILQDDIAIAILATEHLKFPELVELKNILDQDTRVSNRSLRYAIKIMLTEFLFECGDMDPIPQSLFEALDIINRKSRKKMQRDILNDEVEFKAPDIINKKSRKKLKRQILKDEVEQEVECILNVSAQAKQIVWDMFPDNELDLDYADAYVEEMEDEDDDEDDGDHADVWSSDDDNSCTHGLPQEQRIPGSNRSHSDNESTGEARPITCNLPTATTTKCDCNPLSNSSVFHGTSTERHEPEHNTGMDTEDKMDVEPNDMYKQTTCNQYVVIQEVCDKTSMIAHNLVGHMLEKFAWTDGLDLDYDDTSYLKGDCATQEALEEVEETQTLPQEDKGGSVIVSVIEDLIPSFPKSGLEALRNLAGD